MLTLADMIKTQEANNAKGYWMPACGGTEVPFFTRGGLRLLYCWQPSTGNHAYLNLDSDLFLSDSEAQQALNAY